MVAVQYRWHPHFSGNWLFVEKADSMEDEENEPLLITFFSHPHPTRTE